MRVVIKPASKIHFQSSRSGSCLWCLQCGKHEQLVWRDIRARTWIERCATTAGWQYEKTGHYSERKNSRSRAPHMCAKTPLPHHCKETSEVVHKNSFVPSSRTTPRDMIAFGG